MLILIYVIGGFIFYTILNESIEPHITTGKKRNNFIFFLCVCNRILHSVQFVQLERLSFIFSRITGSEIRASCEKKQIKSWHPLLDTHAQAHKRTNPIPQHRKPRTNANNHIVWVYDVMHLFMIISCWLF